MSTVREIWGLACPKCGRDDDLHVAVEMLAHLLPDGTEAYGDQEWGPGSACACTDCNHWATVADFNIDNP